MLNRFTSALRSMGSQISLSSSQHAHIPASVSQRVRAREAFLFHGPKQSSVRMMASEGQIQSELMESMRMKIQNALEAEEVQVTDIQGDGRHVEIIVVSSQFEGKNSVNRQRMVYKVRVIVV
jgi:acid stress-induced BolA-like protein IbaG/YrbA